jgi:hypothetical protein
MAAKYLRSSAAGAGTGADWTNAYTTLAAAMAGVSAGDTIYVANDHAETQTANMTITSPGTAAAPVLVIGVNTNSTVPPTGVVSSPTASITTTTGGTMTFSGFAYIYGINFMCGTSGSVTFNLTSSSSWMYIFDNCTININTTGSGSRINIGSTSTTPIATLVLIDTPLDFGNVTQTINFGNCRMFWRSTSNISGSGLGIVPTTLVTPLNAYSTLEISGVDLSAFGSGKNLVNVGTGTSILVKISNCLLGSSVSVITGTISTQGHQVLLDISDSASTNYRMEHYKYQGKIIGETTVVRTGGASDGTTTISHKFTTNSSGPSLYSPLEGPWMYVWNQTSGSKTITVEFLHDSVTNLKDSEIYLELEYVTTGQTPLSITRTNRAASVVATPADCPAGTGTGNWTTTGLTNPNSQKLTLNFTVDPRMPVRARVCLVKTNYTVYIDPLLTIS